jgi:hypothetical protein
MIQKITYAVKSKDPGNLSISEGFLTSKPLKARKTCMTGKQIIVLSRFILIERYRKFCQTLGCIDSQGHCSSGEHLSHSNISNLPV